MQPFAMTRHRQHRLDVMSHSVGFTGVRRLLTSNSPDGANRGRSMPESSLTEEAAITPDGNVHAASTRATIGVDATGIPSRMAGQLPLFHPSASRPESLGSRGEDEKGSPPTRGMIIDAHTRVDDNSVLSGRADLHPFMELLAERDTPVLIHGGQSIFVLPERAGRTREAPQEEA